MKRKSVSFFLFVVVCLLTFEVADRVLVSGYQGAIGNFVPSRYLFLGSSHTRAAVDWELMETLVGEPVAKIGLPGATTRDKKVLLEYYVEQYGAPEEVFYEVGVLMFDGKRFVGTSFQQLYPLVANATVDRYLYERDELSNYLLRKLFKPLRYNGTPWVYSLRQLADGYRYARARSIDSPAEQKRCRESIRTSYPDRKSEVNELAMELLEDTLRYARSRGIKVHLVYVPESHLLTKYFDFGEGHAALERLQRTYGGEVIDLSDIFEYRNDLFADPDHLNPAGSKLFSELMARRLQGAQTARND